MGPAQAKKVTFILFVVLSRFLLPADAYAAAFSGSSTENYMRMIWGLLIVLGIILVLYGLVKKRFSLLSNCQNKEIRVLEIKPLMGKKAICLVEVRGQEYLLGVAADRITHLATLQQRAGISFADTLAQTGEHSPS